MADLQAFFPTATVAIAGAVTSANVQIQGAGNSILVSNQAAAWAFVAVGDGNTVAATVAGSLPVPPNGQVMMNVGPQFNGFVAAILATGTGQVSFTRGNGTFR